MTYQDLIDFCLTFPAAYEDYPFDEPIEKSTTVMRHRGQQKELRSDNVAQRQAVPGPQVRPVRGGLLAAGVQGGHTGLAHEPRPLEHAGLRRKMRCAGGRDKEDGRQQLRPN